MNTYRSEVVDLLDPFSTLTQQGWSDRPVWRYRSEELKKRAPQFKTWNIFSINMPKHDLYIHVTYRRRRYQMIYSLVIFDTKNHSFSSEIGHSRIRLGQSKVINYYQDFATAQATKNLRVAFSKRSHKRRLLVGSPDITLHDGVTNFNCDISLHQNKSLETFHCARTLQKGTKQFTLKETLLPLSVEGSFTFGEKPITLLEHDALASLHWGFGKMPHSFHQGIITAYGLIDSHLGGFSFDGKHFACIYNNKLYHKEGVILDGHRLVSSELSLAMNPIRERRISKRIFFKKHKEKHSLVSFTGHINLDDETRLEIKDMVGSLIEI
jgi:hypothetical protein